MESASALLLSMLKEKYDFEMDRKKSYDESVSTPITLVSFLVAGIFYSLIDDDMIDLNQHMEFARIAILLPMGFFCILTFIKLHEVYVSTNVYYKSFPSTKDVISDYKNLADYKEVKGPDESKPLEELFTENMIDWYQDCNEQNCKSNDIRMNALYQSKSLIGIAFIFGIILTIFIGLVKSDIL